jgi:hypothetical protein
MKSALFFLGGLLFFFACKKETGVYNLQIKEQQAYFPLEKGQSIVYQVDSIVYDFAEGGGTSVESFTSFAKEVVADTFTDASGLVHHRIERYRTSDLSQPWIFDRYWSAVVTDEKVIKTEDNLRFLRLIFPMDRRSEWNGNLWINSEYEIQIKGDRIRPFVNWNYEVDSIDITRQVGNFSFDSTLVVTEVDETNIIEKRLSRAVYAKHVGLVYKEQWILDSQYCNQTPPPVDCETKPWLDKAEKGYVYKQTVIQY